MEDSRKLEEKHRLLNISQRIKEMRSLTKITQNELAKKVGVNKSTIAGYEMGHRYPSIEKLESIAKALHTSTDYLLGLTNIKHRDDKDIKEWLKDGNLHYDGEPLTTGQIESLNMFLKNFILKDREDKREYISKEIS